MASKDAETQSIIWALRLCMQYLILPEVLAFDL